MFGNTFSVGAFTVLLPAIGRSEGLSDVALGAVAAAFGLAHLPVDVPHAAPHRRLMDLFRPPAPPASDIDTVAPTARFDRLALFGMAAGAAIALSWSSIGTFLLPLRADRDFELERQGVAMLTALPQLVDVMVLLPFGVLAERVGRGVRMLACAMVMMAAAVFLITFGGVGVASGGAVLLGLALAAWMLPISLINRSAKPQQIAWRAGLYRLSVDCGVFLGPLATGSIVGRLGAWPVGLILSALLVAIGIAILRARHCDGEVGASRSQLVPATRALQDSANPDQVRVAPGRSARSMKSSFSRRLILSIMGCSAEGSSK